MKLITMCLALAFTGVASAGDFVPLFNGKNLDGWTERQVRKGQDGRWSVEDGILKAKPGSGWLGTEKSRSASSDLSPLAGRGAKHHFTNSFV